MSAEMSTNNHASEIEACIRMVTGAGQHALHEPKFDDSDVAEVTACIETGLVSSFGTANTAFEEALCAYSGAANAVVTVNGTSAIQLSIEALGFDRNAEILVPALTFAATTNAIKSAGMTPHFIDSSFDDLGVDVTKLSDYLQSQVIFKHGRSINKETGNPIVAIIPVHIFGHIGDMSGLATLSSEYGLTIIEDAAEALGSWRNGTHAGLFGLCGALSFNGNKIITTGAGGAILCDDTDFANRLRHLSTTAKVPHPYEYIHDELGFNFRMANLNAALGLAQMGKLNGYLTNKAALFQRYCDAFSVTDSAKIFISPAASQTNHWLNAIFLSDNAAPYRDDILHYLNANGLGCRPVWTLLSKLAHFVDCPSMDLSSAEYLCDRLINIPSSPHLYFNGGIA